VKTVPRSGWFLIIRRSEPSNFAYIHFVTARLPKLASIPEHTFLRGGIIFIKPSLSLSAEFTQPSLLALFELSQLKIAS